jgi:hypothetical protein
MQPKLMNAPTQHHDLSESGSMILETVLSETSQAQAFLRPLGSFEELLWQMDKRSPLHATLAAHVDGSTTIEEWRSALDQTRQRHPLWSAVIAQTEDGAPFFQTMRHPEVALLVIEDEFAQAWEREVARELSLRIDAENGPLIRAVLMHTDASSMLILSAHHSICDGMSLAFAMRDVLQALSGSKLKKLSLHSSQEHMIGMCSEPKAQRWSGLRPEVSAARTVYRSNSSIIPEVRSLQFSYALTDALRKRARQEKTTVPAALVAATGIVARRNPGYGAGRDLHLCSTISNRGRVGSPEDCGVFFTACDFPLPDSPVDDLWNLARRSKEMLSLGQSEGGVKAALGAVNGIVQSGLDVYSAGEEGGKLFLFDINLSNLGAVAIPTSYGALSLRQLWGPGVLIGFEGEQTVGVSTLNERLSLLHTSHRPLPCFLEQIESTVNLACNS